MLFYGALRREPLTPFFLLSSRKRFSITFLHRASRSLPNVIERLARIFEWLSHPWYPYYPPTNWVWKRSICKPQTKGHPHMKNSFCRISGDELSLFAPIIKIHILSRKKCCQNTNNVKPLCFHDFFDKIIFTIFYVKTKLSKDKKGKTVVFSRFFPIK